MSVPFQLQSTQSRCVRPRFPVRHGVPRVDDRRVPSRIIFATQGSLRWRNAPPGYGPHKTLYKRFAREPLRPRAPPRGGVFDRVFGALAGQAGEPNRLIIDTTHSKAHWTAASPLKREPLRNAPPEPKEGSTPRSTSFATTRNPGCNVALREVGARPEGR